MDKLFSFWFAPENERLWFNATLKDDEMITIKFGYLIDKLMSVYKRIGVPTDDRHLLFNILVFDQIARHVYRYFGDEYPNKFLNIALNCSYTILKNYKNLEPYNEKEIPFVFLPYRHTKIPLHTKYVIKCVHKLMEITYSNSSYIKRFYHSSLRQSGREIFPIKAPDITYGSISTAYLKSIRGILDDASTRTLLYPENSHPKHPILQALRDSIPTKLKPPLEDKPYRRIKIPSITLSVSGGKDSMALATALKYLYDEHPQTFILRAVHINYGNRETSDAEEQLVIYWVSHILKIPLYIRKIDEIKRIRNSKERRFYENLTKNIRLKTYQQVDPDAYIVLGHNYNDTIENIITNISKKQSYENLNGMKMFSKLKTENNKVLKIWRPLLNVTKNEIEDFNKETKTPFTYDSTPDWSDRGKLRDKVIPTLTDFKPEILEGLTNLSKQMSHLCQIYEHYALPQILRDVEEKDGYYQIRYDGEIMDTKVLRDIFKHFDIPQPSQKSMNSMLSVLRRPRYTTVSITLSKSYTISVDKKNIMVLPIP